MNFKEAFELCTKKAKVQFEKITEAGEEIYEYAGSDDGNYDKPGLSLQHYYNWLTSMYTGMAAIMFETMNDKQALKWANKYKHQYDKKVTGFKADAMHDLGFLYLPYSVHIYNLTGDIDHRDTAIKAADLLLKRYHVDGEFIESWDEVYKPDCEGRLIIDSMMNVPLLLWAWKESGKRIYREVAIKHIETTIKTVVRDDYSVCHAYFMGIENGKERAEANSCGFANGSHWARGTGWMVYGLTVAYNYTGCEKYLDLAIKIADKFIDCLTEEDMIPVWDFRLPENSPARACRPETKEPMWDESLPENKKLNRDTSAAAIMCCALQLICRVRENKRFAETIEKLLTALCDKYLSTDEKVAGMLRCSNGMNKYTTYGDYYFYSALAMHEFGIHGAW